MKQLLSESARYNAWANERLINLFRSIDDAVISQKVVSSFSSIRATLLHLWDVETLWLERLKGNSPTEYPSQTFRGPNEEIYEGLLTASNNLVEYIVTRPAPFYRDRVSFTTLFSDEEWRESVTDMVFQCLNHSTFHRGQLIVMCRQLDIKPIPKTDYIVYRREALVLYP